MDAEVVRQLGVERADEEPPLAQEHRLAVQCRRGPRRRHPHPSTRGARMKTPRSGSGSPASSRSASKLATCLPYAFRRTEMSTRPRWSRSRRIIPAQVPNTGLLEAPERLLEPVDPREAHDRRRLPARDHEAVEPVELVRLANLHGLGAQPAQHGCVLPEIALDRQHPDAHRGNRTHRRVSFLASHSCRSVSASGPSWCP